MRQANNYRRGVALVLAALLCLVLVPMIGLAIDGGISYLMRAKVSRAVDAAVIAGARSLNMGIDVPSQRSNATAVAQKYFDANLPSGDWGSRNIARSVTVNEDIACTPPALRVRCVTISASLDSPLFFMNVLHHPTAHISVTGTARRRDVNIVLILDHSSSMVSGNAITPMQAAAKSFVDKFASGRDRVGLVVFGLAALAAFHPSTTFQSASPNVDTLIGEMATGGNTGTAQALWLGYQELANIPTAAGALNVLVLFTDGLPNGITADFNPYLTATSTCQNKILPKFGGIAQWGGDKDPGTTVGVINPVAPSITDIGENQPAANSNGCAYASDETQMRQDIARMPDFDGYGNATTGYKPVDLTRVDLPTQIVHASINAADAAATRIRTDILLKPYIYTIGLGGTDPEPPDPDFMKRISNVPSSQYYNSAQPTGLYIWSPSSEQLQTAFLRIASEILRLSQ